MLINLDHGAMPAANVYIKKDFSIDEAQIGLLMALVFLGFIFGSFITPCLSKTLQYKNALILACLLNGIG